MNYSQPHPDSVYYHVVVNALQRANVASATLKEHKAKLEAGQQIDTRPNVLTVFDETEFDLRLAVVTAITFSAMCLEAFVNGCYAELLPDLFENVEQFRHQAKWQMLPLLLGSKKTFDTGSEPWQTFEKLVQDRNNRLMHFKPPKERSDRVKTPQSYFGDLIADIPCAEKYRECIAGMISELNKLTEARTKVPQFLHGAKYTSTVTATFSVAMESLGPIE